MDLERIGVGRLADVYALDEERALKLYRTPERNDLARVEAAATRSVHDAGAPCASCHGTMEVGDRVGIVLDRLPGPVMGDMLGTGRDQDLATDLATLTARIHDSPGDGFTDIIDRQIQQIERVNPPEASAVIIDRLRVLAAAPRALLHSDLHVLNVMRNDAGEWVAIDWYMALQGPPLYDVARCMFLLSEATIEDEPPGGDAGGARLAMAEQYLETYRSHCHVADEELAAWRLPILASRIGENIAREHDYLRAEIDAEIRRGAPLSPWKGL